MPPKSWPSEGAITFDKLYLRYSKAEGHVLKNLTFAIEAKQKVCVMISLTI
jgi:ABC-type multidrug transport system fused ATPase/permease subunit